ncbi:MAG TPA: methionine--tRNA ligase [Thermosynergistes sp.]|nr:methionine--tRNA ligase [Thermosynergistes sp.]
MEEKRRFFITTPIYYVNDVPHIGHAYTTVAADVMARYHRMKGEDVLFSTGTDEHGQKIQRAAANKGMTSKELADKTVENFKALWQKLNISNDDFIRTTEERHHKTVQTIFGLLREKGDIYKGTYEGWYCVPCETYVPESQMGEGRTCPSCGRQLEMMSEESYFFRMSSYQGPLLKYYEEHPDAILPESRYNEIVSFIRGGLKDQSVSRTTISWGIPVPGDEKHVIYVWFDALINYLTVCGYPDDERWRLYWPEVRHLVGKDIARFHCVIWPAMLLAAGLTPPKQVFAHGWWTVEGEKMSKSLGNVVDPFEMVDLYGVDPFRYFLLREVPFGLDGDFSELAMVSRINSDLANDLGNLLSRTLQMVIQFKGGKVPCPGETGGLESDIASMAERSFEAVDVAMRRFAYDEALKTIWAFIGRANKYIDETEPWRLGREGKEERLDTVLFTLCESLRLISLLIAPFIPDAAERLWNQLGLSSSPQSLGYASFRWGNFPPGTAVKRGSSLFPRIDIKRWEERKRERDLKKGRPVDPGEHEEEISIDEFKKVELRVARILSAAPVAGTDKLYKIEVDLGYEKRTIVSGIREHYSPEELVGKVIIVVCNLKPAKLRGIESKGMLLAAEGHDGGLALLTVDRDIPLGSRIH